MKRSEKKTHHAGKMAGRRGGGAALVQGGAGGPGGLRGGSAGLARRGSLGGAGAPVARARGCAAGGGGWGRRAEERSPRWRPGAGRRVPIVAGNNAIVPGEAGKARRYLRGHACGGSKPRS